MMVILLGFLWAPASLGRGLLLVPQGACGHLSLQPGGDEDEEQVVFGLCVTAASEFTGSGCQLCLKKKKYFYGLLFL